jgi:hypothetical protein
MGQLRGVAMKRHLALVTFVLFLLAFGYDLVVWGAAAALPDIGPGIVLSANHEAPLAATYIGLGRPLDAAFPALQAFGLARLDGALGEGYERIKEDPHVAVDLIFNTTWNNQHRWIKTVYWAAPLLLLLSIVLWLLRPKAVKMMGRR